MKLEEYYKQMGFERYPFTDRTAEKEDTRKLFVKPEKYELLLNTFEEKQTCIVNCSPSLSSLN